MRKELKGSGIKKETIGRRERDEDDDSREEEKKAKGEEKVMRSIENRERPQNRSLDSLYPRRRG